MINDLLVEDVFRVNSQIDEPVLILRLHFAIGAHDLAIDFLFTRQLLTAGEGAPTLHGRGRLLVRGRPWLFRVVHGWG